MSALSKEYVVRIAAKAHAKGYHCGPPAEGSQFFTPTQLQHFADLICADLVAKNEHLEDTVARIHKTAGNRLIGLCKCGNERDELRDQLAAAQAKIDSLMLEYCPDEMTPEQIENWGKHQKAVSDQTNLLLQLSP